MIDDRFASLTGGENILHDSLQHGTDHAIGTQNKMRNRLRIQPGLRLAILRKLKGIQLDGEELYLIVGCKSGEI